MLLLLFLVLFAESAIGYIRWSWLEIMRLVLANRLVIFFFPIVELFYLLLIVRQKYLYQLSRMGRKTALKTILSKSSTILPYTINTLYNEDAEDLNNLPSKCNLVTNMLGIKHKLQRLRLTAAEAQCATLAGSQVYLSEKLFVVHKNANQIGKWISQDYNNPKDYDCFINAGLMHASHPTMCNEESVSFPFLNADTHRFKNIRVSYIDFEGANKQEQIEGFRSFAFQQAWDYSVGLHIIDWRVHHGTLQVQEDVRKHLPKITSVLEQYSQELNNIKHKFPKLFQVPQKIEQSQMNWFINRAGESISIESDYVTRIHKHYRKQMLLFLEKLNLNLI